ncbi:caspase b-like [Triplophysa rosa]|uniref:Pyrin domain-containing protein n=1 Tax=Triplophysa rosa TaxID=992332 RepID=A0A9W7WZM4_TRIRA|nr:caspase b-like [Triplophysa rosa]KAI7811053.1 hypothetical protein IRJ41_009796 [Triplophysa rosa]
MAATKTVLLEALQDLTEQELKDFKWRLCNSKNSDIKSIPRGTLENTSRYDVVDVMVQRYGASDAATIAVSVLRLIKHNELADQLTGKLQEVSSDSEVAGASAGAGAGAGAGASSGAGAQTSGLSVNIQSSNGASVKAPVIHGGVFNGPLTFN